MIRNIIDIDENLCNGCEECVKACPEGAIRMIDGKARLVGEILCDGLGACLDVCPVNAISVERREAEQYDERKVMENIAQYGPEGIKAHLEHLEKHGQTGEMKIARQWLHEKGMAVPRADAKDAPRSGGCPGSAGRSFQKPQTKASADSADQQSQLTNWPVQLHLAAPHAPWFKGAHVLLAADCTAFALGNFHRDHLKDKKLIIACPKLDSNQEIYRDKLKALIEESEIASLDVIIMEVPCCRGLAQMAVEAVRSSGRDLPVRILIAGIQGGGIVGEMPVR